MTKDNIKLINIILINGSHVVLEKGINSCMLRLSDIESYTRYDNFLCVKYLKSLNYKFPFKLYKYWLKKENIECLDLFKIPHNKQGKIGEIIGGLGSIRLLKWFYNKLKKQKINPEYLFINIMVGAIDNDKHHILQYMHNINSLLINNSFSSLTIDHKRFAPKCLLWFCRNFYGQNLIDRIFRVILMLGNWKCWKFLISRFKPVDIWKGILQINNQANMRRKFYRYISNSEIWDRFSYFKINEYSNEILEFTVIYDIVIQNKKYIYIKKPEQYWCFEI
jgi:hypothetical protein